MVAAFQRTITNDYIDQLLLKLVNVEAEQAILGGILLDPEAIERLVDGLSAEAFSVESHKIIYRAAVNLHSQGRPTDLMTVTTWLADHNTLEKVGGTNKLVQLVDRTVSAVNIDQYAGLVMDKYMRRKLVLTGCNLTDLASRSYWELPEILEEAEFQTHAITDLRSTPFSQYQQSESEIQLKQLTREIEKIEAIKSKNPFKYKLEIKNLMKRWDMRSEKEFFDFHAKWLQISQKSRSFSIDEYLEMFGGKSIKWLLDGWIPGSTITVVHSKGGVGKTSLLLTISKALISGNSWCGYDVNKPLKILWIQTDQGPTVTTRFLDRQGFFKLDPHVRERQRIIDKWGIEEYHILEEELKQYNYDLVVIDCLSTVSSSLIYRENDQEYARPLARLREIGNKHNCSFLVLHHSGWDGKIRGTTAIYNAADQVWALEEAKPSGINLTVQKSRFMATPCSYRLEFDSETYSWSMVGEISRSEDGEEEFNDLSARPSFQKLYQFLKTNRGVGFEAAELSEHTGINDGTVRKELGFGLSKGLIESFQGYRQRAVYFVGELTSSAYNSTDNDEGEDKGLTVLGNFNISLPNQGNSVSQRTSDPLDPDCGSGQNPYPVSVDPVDPVEPHFLSLQTTSSNSKKHGSTGSSGSTHTQSEFHVDPGCGSSGSTVTELNNEVERSPQLTDADVEDFAGLIRYAIAHPEAAISTQESFLAYFAENPGKEKVWQALLPHEREAFKELTAKPTDGLGQEVKVGDRVQSLHSDQKVGKIIRLEPNFRGSPKRPFIQWTTVVSWDNGEEDDEVVEFLKVQGNDSEKPIDIKAITLHQPWASLVGRHKHYETRGWSTDYRGKIAIHAGKATANCSTELLELIGNVRDLPMGVIVAIADLVDCIEMTPELIAEQSETELLCGDWKPGRFAWKLENVRRLEIPIPARGYQGLWDWKPTAEGPDLSTPDTWRPKVGERCQNLNGVSLTIKEDKNHSFIVVYDNDTSEGVLHLEHLKPLAPEQDPKVIAQQLFSKIQPGDELKALKHPSHVGFARRRGRVIRQAKINDKFLVECETSLGIQVFNLEAVEICSNTKQ
ncbi:DnaB-like helicase N-terminal domain-containing protein [Microseira sp. BLCC-F43]|jgi:replicative DNA helicase|uniref:DnaB-like helicase N-terminal domain-containing protein n=1 Tax=Microseira sp. BLCC-F43 TaxID=3153602 RepID=UPI0035B94DDE